MKKLLLLISGIALCFHVQSQGFQNVGCIDPVIRQQSQDQKKLFIDQQFSLTRDAMIGMHGMEPYPVVASLTKGTFYQIIFIGNPKAKLDLEIFNSEDVKLGEKKETSSNEKAKIISFSFVPEQTGSYLFVLTQKMKYKEICGSFSIMELKNNTSATPVKE